MGIPPSTTPTPSDFAAVRYRSSTITSIVTATAVIVTLFYLAALYLVAQRWVRDYTSLNKYSSVRLQRSAPCTSLLHLIEVVVADPVPIVVYLLLVLTGIIEVGTPNRSQLASAAQEKSDLDISLDTRTIWLQSQLPFRSS